MSTKRKSASRKTRRKPRIKKRKKETILTPPRSPETYGSDVDEHGNIAGLIASDDESDVQPEIQTTERTLTKEEEVKELLESFPYSPSLLKEQPDSSGPRRSRRKRKAPTRFFPKEYVDVFLQKGGKIDREDVEAVYTEELSDNSEHNSEDEEYSLDREDDDDDYNSDYKEIGIGGIGS